MSKEREKKFLDVNLWQVYLSVLLCAVWSIPGFNYYNAAGVEDWSHSELIVASNDLSGGLERVKLVSGKAHNYNYSYCIVWSLFTKRSALCPVSSITVEYT